MFARSFVSAFGIINNEKLGSRLVIGKLLGGVIAVVGAAALTLTTIIALVEGTILAVSLPDLPLRILAVAADIVIGTALLVGCIYLATHLAVRILGVGNAEFPPLPDSELFGGSRPINLPRN